LMDRWTDKIMRPVGWPHNNAVFDRNTKREEEHVYYK